MALNPAFASASVNPSQTMGNDASVNPTQGALPTGMPQNTGFSGLGGQANQPQYTSPLNQPSAPDVSENAYQRYAGQQTLAGGATQQYGDWANSQAYGGIPMNYQPTPPPFMPQGNMPQIGRPLGRFNPATTLPDGTRNSEGGSYEYPQQPQAPYNNGQLRYDSGDNVMPQVGNLGNDVEIPKLNYLGYKPGWQQEADNTWSFNTPNMSPYNQYDQDWNPQYIGYRGVTNDMYQDALSRGDFSGITDEYTSFTKPRYISFGNDKADYSQIGLSQTALDHLKMMSGAQDAGQFSYDTQTGMFNQGAGWGPNPRPGQRVYTGMTDIPLDVMNKLGSGEEIDFSPYRRYTNGFNTEGQPNPPQIGDQPLPVQQPLVGGLQDPQTNPFQNPLNDFKNTEQWQRVAPNYAGLPQNVQDYVASQLSQGAMDGGTNWQYNPTTQTFSGTPNGMTLGKPTPEVKSLAQMKDYVNWINSPNASTTKPPASWERPPIIQGSLGDLRTATQTGTTPMATNPLSQLPVAQTAAFTPAPVVGTPSSGGGSFTQGAPLPNITTTQQQVTAAPEFYTDYLNQLAKQGASTAQNAQYVGATDLQNQAFDRTSQNVGNYQSALQNAINLAQNVGSSNLSEAIGNLGQANIARNLSPQATAGIVGSGQFGSKRGAAALGDTIANAQLGITAQQAQALQQDMQNRLAASQQLGNLASSTQQLGLGDINALATMGGQKQTIAQNEQLFPMQQLTNQSQLLRGYTIPTSTGSSYTGPIPGAYAASPLQQIAGLGALGAGISQTKLGDAIGNLIGGTPAASKAAQAALSSLFNIRSKSPNVTTSTTIGDISASIKTLPDGRPNPNYDAYADPNATDADRLQQNLMNTPVNPDIDNFDYSNIPSVTDEFDYSGFPE